MGDGVIYLDHNATTPVLPVVRDAMLPLLTEAWGNPSSSYRFGGNTRKLITRAREQLAQLVDCEPDEIVFTSGATEANNAALNSCLLSTPAKRHVVTCGTEHSSVLVFCDEMGKRGYEVTKVPVAADGTPSLEAVRAALRKDTALVSLMWANNETGAITQVTEIAAVCQAHGVPFHCDAVQAVSKLPLSFASCGTDLLAISGHKLGAPKGIGALIVRSGFPFTPLILGGKQEKGRRGGTENTASIVGFGAACEVAQQRLRMGWERVRALRDSFETRLLMEIPGAYLNHSPRRLPNTSNFGIRGFESSSLVALLDQADVCISSGSACMESALAPSHVVLAATGDHQRAKESIRVSLGFDTTDAEIDGALKALAVKIALLR